MRFGKRFLALAVIAASTMFASSASAQDYWYGSSPVIYGSPAPVAVPQWAGHTYITYPPLYPSQMLYRHTDRYHYYYDGGRSLNSTKVHYGTSPVRTGVRGMVKHFSLPR